MGATFRMDCKLFLVIASVVVLASLDLKNQAAARSCGNVRSEGITVFNFTDVNTDVIGLKYLTTFAQPSWANPKQLWYFRKTVPSSAESSSVCSTRKWAEPASLESVIRSSWN